MIHHEVISIFSQDFFLFLLTNVYHVCVAIFPILFWCLQTLFTSNMLIIMATMVATTAAWQVWGLEGVIVRVTVETDEGKVGARVTIIFMKVEMMTIIAIQSDIRPMQNMVKSTRVVVIAAATTMIDQLDRLLDDLMETMPRTGLIEAMVVGVVETMIENIDDLTANLENLTGALLPVQSRKNGLHVLTRMDLPLSLTIDRPCFTKRSRISFMIQRANSIMATVRGLTFGTMRRRILLPL
jgi:hypothetical protein